MTAAKKIKTSPALAKMLIDLDPSDTTKVFVLKSPMAGHERAAEIRGEKNLFGVKFVEGVGVTTDRELAELIHAEFPQYEITEA